MPDPPIYEPLPPDIVERINRDFGDRADAVAAQLLASRQFGSADNISDRIVRCIIHAAAGNATEIEQLIDWAHQDYRDVIMLGEYDKLRVIRLRNYQHPFGSADFIEY